MSIASKIPIAVIALVAVVGGLGTGMAASLGMADGSPFMGEVDAEAGGEPVEPLEIHGLGNITVNLSEPGGSRLLRMQLAVEATASVGLQLQELEPRLRDDIIRFTSDQTYAALEGAAGKEQLRADLLQRINAILDPAAVESVFFHSFVVH